MNNYYIRISRESRQQGAIHIDDSCVSFYLSRIYAFGPVADSIRSDWRADQMSIRIAQQQSGLPTQAKPIFQVP